MKMNGSVETSHQCLVMAKKNRVSATKLLGKK